MQSPLPKEKAMQYCLELQALLDVSESLAEVKLYPHSAAETLLAGDQEASNTVPATGYGTGESGASLSHSPNGSRAEAAFPVQALWKSCNGHMFGVLVCRDSEGNEVVLQAFSGQFEGCWTIPGWVPPICDVEAFTRVTETYENQLKQLTDEIDGVLPSAQKQLKIQRKSVSLQCLKEIYALYTIKAIDGSSRPLLELFADRLPPTGTGDCCAPKLLQCAFLQGLQPISLAEFYYGSPNKSGSKQHKEFYDPCDDKCKPVLQQMLGLEILFADSDIVVVDKESGMLSVPGRGPEKQDCVEARVRRLFPEAVQQPAVHRLDMDTSGVLILALTREAHRALSMQFMEGAVEKKYIALLEGIIVENSGAIELPFRLDPDDRPRQIYDDLHGKVGITKWEKIRVERFPSYADYPARHVTRVMFSPETGRTHQLRVHSAHPKGLGHPIVGDRLYGNPDTAPRLMLHAQSITFRHPRDQKYITITSNNTL